jgi:inner membrane protein
VRPAWATSAIANNLPDLDFAYARITDGPLGYLLHHRGHTHTLMLAPPIALLAFGIGLLWLRRASPAPSRADIGWLAALALAGPVLHVAMDGANSYGVHPFWPLDAGWVFGDSVFIVEPLFWAITLPVLIAETRWWPGRVTFALLLAATFVLPWLSGLVPPSLSLVVMVIALSSSLAAFRLGAHARVWIALWASLLVLVLFVASSRLARARATALLEARFPGARTHDIVLSPLPANPLCWSLIAVQSDREMLIERRGALSIAPGAFPAAGCPERGSGGSTAPLVPVPGRDQPGLELGGQFEAPLAELRALEREHCTFAALLRFARAPFWKIEGERLIAGDLRYDRSPGRDFPEISVERSAPRCPRFVPSWTPPRQDLLSAP